ncbi:MAG TPA: hypothetical protein VKP64_15615 [Mycobacteriales bacterium]|nr:hypothetical protein [Mycobacteriales bacterium]
MRRVLAAISNFSDIGDTTSLANPEVVEEIRRFVQREKLATHAARPLSPERREKRLFARVS